ncbi:hypothetical protein DVH24_020006 [Malus domestica]|uniref:Uncharacterized protein n=1 Tax=Malus domestica TaxID=3750 RepID=A0A498HZT9_MALDO|nr:hypothetical protein DVH24_020006 [Malus domestica]
MSNHRSRLVVCASARTAFEVDQAPTSATSSNLLPFRVGYGFDRHRLEPRYPLIIDDIDLLMTEVGMRIPTGLWASGYHAYSS